VVGDRMIALDSTTTTTSSVGSTTTTSPGSTTTTSPGATTTTPTVTTTSNTGTPGVDVPVVNPGVLNQFAHGCGLHMTAATTTTTTSTSTSGPTTTLAAPTTTVPRVAGVGRCTILEIGDSLGNDLGWGIAREVVKPRGLRLIQLDKS
jgi:hypothetical protein